MEYGFQIRVQVEQDRFEWQDVRPTGGTPYRYSTRAEAERMARMCYGDDSSLVRVVECANE